MKGALAGILLTSYALAQTASFEVASVRAANPNDTRRPQIQYLPGGRILAVNLPLYLIIASAWKLPYNASPRLTGAPEWTRAERFDISAQTGRNAMRPGLPPAARNDNLRLMLQGLLADRFKLDVRTETKKLPIFAVVVGKSGLKLEKASIEEKDCVDSPAPAGPSCHQVTGGQGRGLHADAVTISDIASYVENWAERPVVDKTGLTELYKVQTRGWLPMQPGPPPATGLKAEDGSDMTDLPTLFEVFERMGLKLEAQEAAVNTYRVEHVERPSLN